MALSPEQAAKDTNENARIMAHHVGKRDGQSVEVGRPEAGGSSSGTNCNVSAYPLSHTKYHGALILEVKHYPKRKSPSA